MFKRFYFLLCLLLFCCWLPTTLTAQTGCVQGDCQNGVGVKIFNSGGKYIGHFKKGKLDGVGSFYYTDGSKYQGQWKNNYPDGEGIKTLADGSKKKGFWKKGKEVDPPQEEAVVQVSSPVDSPEPSRQEEVVIAEPEPPVKQQKGCVSGNCKNGKGIYIYPSGAMYIGHFSNGQINGIGVCYYSNGSKYQGNWLNRYPHGKGTKKLADGRSWTGQWIKGQPIDQDGQIIAELFPRQEDQEVQTDVQTGCVSGDCVDGEGVFAYADGSEYEGQFNNGKPNGQGIIRFQNNEKYSGGFQNGLKHGKGTYYMADGTQQQGQWDKDVFVQDQRANKKGCISGDCLAGTGTFVYPNGDKYEGQWSNAQRNGKGTLIKTDGTIVQGNWKEDAFLAEVTPTRPKPQEVESGEFQRPKVWAVIVGVASYNHMPTLRFTDDDAYRVYAFLRSPKGGALEGDQIKLLIDEDATYKNITKSMKETFKKAGPNDLIMLYFSGHGLNGAFLPIDFDGFNNRLEHIQVKAILDQSPAKFKLCIADACHSGSLLAMRSGTVKGVLESYYETLSKAKAGTALIMSSKSEETSLESKGLRQGVFSHYLIRGLEGEADSAQKDNVITIQELYDFVNTNVRLYSGNRQSPLIEGDYDPNMPVSVIGY